MPGEVFVCRAFDVLIANSNFARQQAAVYMKHLATLDPSKASGLVYEIPLKEGVRYMMRTNLDVEDGLVNGTTGVLKYIVKDKDNQRATLLWFDYGHDEIGRKTRAEAQKNLPAYRQILERFPNWTPLSPMTVTLKLQKTCKDWRIKRTQFDIVAAEVLTIHKAQGQTYSQGVAVNVTNNMTRQLMYVAMSRCTKLDKLYLFGCESINPKWTLSLMHKKRLQVHKQDRVYLEMQRMRLNSPLEISYPFLSDDRSENDGGIPVMFHNVAALRPHLPQINADFGCKQCDVLFFVECHSNTSTESKSEQELALLRTELQIEGFELLHLTGKLFRLLFST